MAYIDFDNDKMSLKVLPKVNQTISNLDRLISHNNAISIPYGFKYTSFFNEYRNVMNTVRKNYKGQRDFLEQANKKIETVMNNMDSDLYSIQNEDIKSRGEIL